MKNRMNHRAWRRAWALPLIALFVAAGFGPLASAEEDVRRVLVPPFENYSSKKNFTTYEVPVNSGGTQRTISVRVDSYAHGPRTGLEEILGQYISPNFQLVERQRLDQMLVEGEFAQAGMMVDQNTAIQLGKALGANTAVLGSIRSIESERKKFSGYGITQERLVTTCRISVRAIDLETGAILKVKSFQGVHEMKGSSVTTTTVSDPARLAIEDALAKLAEDEEFVKGIAGLDKEPEVKLVKITIGSNPEGADLLIDGEYFGNTPMEIELPEGKRVKIGLELPGYKPWERPMTIKAGMSPTPTLRPE